VNDAFYFQGDFSGDPGTFTGPTVQASSSTAASQGVLAVRASLTVSTPAIPDSRAQPGILMIRKVTLTAFLLRCRSLEGHGSSLPGH